jgi:type VI secretion system secreted protein VgrG
MTTATNQYTQANRKMRLSTPLGDDVLLLQNLTYQEEMGRPFEMTLTMQSPQGDIDFSKIIGRQVTVTLDLPKGGHRHFNGFVKTFGQTATSSLPNLATYQAVVVPWLSLLSLATDCRSFQGKAIPEILQDVFSEFGFHDFRLALTHQYVPREFCIQYRESAFNFVSRLMEFAGITYFFEHEEGTHTLVLSDSAAVHRRSPDYEEIRYNPFENSLPGTIQEWKTIQDLQPAMVTLDDYDYSSPNTPLLFTKGEIQQHAQRDLKNFDAPGGYQSPEEGEQFARIRLEEIQCRQVLSHGRGRLPGLCTGRRFTLSNFPREDRNEEYLVCNSTLEVTSPSFLSEQSDAQEIRFLCNFSAIPFSTPFRTARTTPKPVIQGIQTAVVTGPEGQKDKPYPSPYGSIKVKFRWDHRAKADQSSSIWIRVSQLSAGNGWGSMFVPRIGNEVIVSFEEGDPDRPVITGRLYNALQMPPLPLPENALMSYINDDGGNAISMNPSDGKQALILYCPYNDTGHFLGCNGDD